MKALLALSIIVPVGLLTTLRLTGILQEPITETITLETIKWEIERPYSYPQVVTVNKTLDSTYVAEGFSVMLRLWIYEYVDSVSGYDLITMAMKINSTATNLGAYIENVYIVFGKDLQPSIVDLQETSFSFKYLTLTGFSDGITSAKAYKEAFATLTNANRSNRVYLSIEAIWELLTPNNQTHEIELSYELTYHNGTAHKKIIQPFQLKILGR